METIALSQRGPRISSWLRVRDVSIDEGAAATHQPLGIPIVQTITFPDDEATQRVAEANP
jgi:hypothetical protein